MTDYILFCNDGEIPVNAFKLLGASTKRGDDSKIGYYGSGLKYAFALMLREQIAFRVFSGLNEVKISKRSTKFIDQKIDVMTVNGEKTSITLDAGVDWEPWFAIREIYSNTIDENGTMAVGAEVKPEKGKTKIYIDTKSEKLEDIVNNWNNYFTTTRPIAQKTHSGNILTKLPINPYFTVFRKGIRVYSNDYFSLFDYDLRNIAINESRVVKHSWDAEQKASELLALSNLEVILKFLELGESSSKFNHMEWKNNFWNYTTSSMFSKDWLTAIGQRKLVPFDNAGRWDITDNTLVLPDQLILRLKKRFGSAVHVMGEDKEPYTVIDNADLTLVESSLKLFNNSGLKVSMASIKVARFDDQNVLGLTANGQIILSEKLLTTEKQNLDSTLLEEITHLKSGYGDCTRALQDYLFRTIVYLIKKGRTFS